MSQSLVGPFAVLTPFRLSCSALQRHSPAGHLGLVPREAPGLREEQYESEALVTICLWGRKMGSATKDRPDRALADEQEVKLTFENVETDAAEFVCEGHCQSGGSEE